MFCFQSQVCFRAFFHWGQDHQKIGKEWMLSSVRNGSIHHWFAYGRLFLPFCCRGLISIKGPQQLKPSQTYIYKCEQGQPSAFWVPALALESRLANFLCQGFALCQTPCWHDLSGFPPDRLTGSQRQEPPKNCSCWIERPWDQESAILDAAFLSFICNKHRACGTLQVTGRKIRSLYAWSVVKFRSKNEFCSKTPLANRSWVAKAVAKAAGFESIGFMSCAFPLQSQSQWNNPINVGGPTAQLEMRIADVSDSF